MIDLMQIPASEAERLAYTEGFTGTAELFGRIADAEALADPDLEDKLREEISDLESERDELEAALEVLVQQLREDIPPEQGSRHLWEAVQDAEALLK